MPSSRAPPTSDNGILHSMSSASTSQVAGSTIVKIEQIIETVLESLGRGQTLTMPFARRRSRPGNTQSRPGRRHGAGPGSGTVSFPGASAAESKLFTQVLSILQLSHQALLSGTFVTKRNIFYQYRDLFREQRVVDGLVDDLAYTLGTGRDSLNIVAASVGVVCGQLSYVARDGTHCFASSQENGIVIPPLREILDLDLSACQWILVIEKEATFRTLATSGYWSSSMAGPGALVTSKGYPTLVTRWFLNRVHAVAPQLPIYGLVDYDPHGVRIFRTYKYGSQSLSHEQDTTVFGMKWLGIRSSDLLRGASAPTSSWSPLDDALPLTEADRKTAASLLHEISCSNGYVDHEPSVLEQYRELQVMLMLNVKAEIQAADDYGDLASWLDKKLYRAQEGD